MSHETFLKLAHHEGVLQINVLALSKILKEKGVIGNVDRVYRAVKGRAFKGDELKTVEKLINKDLEAFEKLLNG